MSMLKERRLAGEKIAAQLFAAEAAIDAALAAAAGLAAVIPGARQEAGLPAHYGHDALMQAIDTTALLARSRAAIIATHDALAITQKQAGLAAVNFGSWVEKPPVIGVPSGNLTVVPTERKAA